jgi:hypothetical protein
MGLIFCCRSPPSSAIDSALPESENAAQLQGLARQLGDLDAISKADEAYPIPPTLSVLISEGLFERRRSLNGQMSISESLQSNGMPIYHNWINKIMLGKQASSKPSSYPDNATAVEVPQVRAAELNQTTTTPSSTSAHREPSYSPHNTLCHELIRAWLMRSGKSDDWRKYNLSIQHAQGERMIALDEKPFEIFKSGEYQSGQFRLRCV